MNPGEGTNKTTSPVLENFQRFFKKSDPIPLSPLDIDMFISVPSTEATTGTQKKITYTINEIPENLVVKIPPGIRSGQILRVKEKGKRQGEKRGDLLLSIQVK